MNLAEAARTALPPRAVPLFARARSRHGPRPVAQQFQGHNVLNEIYCLGWVLSYIFTGREALKVDNDEVGRIVQKCVANDMTQCYRRATELIADVERLEFSPTGAPA
jgi:hypothetical protein